MYRPDPLAVSVSSLFLKWDASTVTYLLEGRFPHHGAVAFGHYGKLMYEVFKFLGVKNIGFNQPKGMLYKSENPFA